MPCYALCALFFSFSRTLRKSGGGGLRKYRVQQKRKNKSHRLRRSIWLQSSLWPMVAIFGALFGFFDGRQAIWLDERVGLHSHLGRLIYLFELTDTMIWLDFLWPAIQASRDNYKWPFEEERIPLKMRSWQKTLFTWIVTQDFAIRR